MQRAIVGQRKYLYFFGALVLPWVALGARGQQFQPKSIQFKGDPEYSHAEMMDAAGLKDGQVLTYAEMNDCSKKLMATGMFASLYFKFDGQDLVFQVTPAAEVFPVRLVNLPLTPGADLDAKLHAALPLYHGKVPAEGGLNEQVRAALEQMLTAEGLKATVTATPGSNLGSSAANWIGYSIQSPAVQPVMTGLDGVSAPMTDGVAQVVKEVEKDGYDTNATAHNLEQAVALFYQDRGYPGVKVVAARAGAPQVTAEAVQVPFRVTVQEGKLYKLGTVTVPADSPVTEADAEKLLSNKGMHLQQGTRLRGLLQTVKIGYATKGYLDCKVALKPAYDDASDTVNYTITAVPGPVSHLAFVKFANVGDNLRKVLMRNWTMMPGDVFNEPFAADYLLHLTATDPRLGRALAGWAEKMTTTEDPATHDVNVVIELVHQP
ncbi:MAG TPA: hypothetical protein VFU55_05175 [Terracidiphilus sp.]|nr:hypothetical protein [Terracidiphilus sp.]